MSDSMRGQRRSTSSGREVRLSAWGRWRSDDRGSVSVVVALSMSALLAFLALGIDLGALFDARSEAQRAADAAALAGASAFLDYQRAGASGPARARAVEYATSNEIRNMPILPSEVTVSVNLDSSTVSARVHRDGVPTWFARLLGIDSVSIGAQATAWAGAGAAAQCLKPFAVPDMWQETSDDLNGNRIWDEGERWRFDPDKGDRYDGFSGGLGGFGETGYGSDWRDRSVDAQGRRFDGDYGRQITIKVTDPQATIMSSFFLPWVLPEDEGQEECGGRRPGGGRGNGGGTDGSGDPGSGGGDSADPPGEGNGNGFGWLKWWEKREDLGIGGGSRDENPGSGGGSGGTGTTGGVTRIDGARGAAAYRRNICTCNRNFIDLDSEFLVEPGNMVGPTYQGVRTLIEQDPGAHWDEASSTVVSQYGMDSPRVVTVALFDPAEINKPGRQYIRFNNFARVFIEEQASPQDPVTGRFLYYVRGVGRGGESGETTGSLIRVLQLIR